MIPKLKELQELAINNLKNSYSPYSNFPVSAVLITKNGEIFTGVNIENASYGLSMCAERVCLFNYRNANLDNDPIDTILVTGQTAEPIAPCGACRQVMAEFLNDDTKIVLSNIDNKFTETNITELLPGSFKQEDLH